jgi:DNA-binding transcriptional ArsR family regulator
MRRRHKMMGLGAQETGGLATLFKAIGDPTRQQILLLLEKGERSVNEIVEHFKLSQPTISRHLGVLHQTGLISRRRDGQRVVYSLRPESVKCCCEDFFGNFDCCTPFFGGGGHRKKKR